MISKNENSLNDAHAYSDYSIDELIAFYEKMINHYLRNTLQVIISLIDMHTHLFEQSQFNKPQFEMLQSEIRSLICVYDLKKIENHIETVDLVDMIFWFKDYFEENSLFCNNRFIITIKSLTKIPLKIQNSQHITLFIHEIFVQIYILLEQLHIDKASLSIDYDNNNAIILTINLDTITEETNIEFPVFLENMQYSHFKLNSELFQLLIEQLRGTIFIENQQKVIRVFIPLSAIGQTPLESWRSLPRQLH